MNKYQRVQMKKAWRVLCRVNGCTNKIIPVFVCGKNKQAARRTAKAIMHWKRYKRFEIVEVKEF